MFTIRLAQLLAGEQVKDERIANRLGTMHYFLNRCHPEQYEQFLEYLERFDSGRDLECALRGYLKRHESQVPTRPLRVAVTECDNRMERRRNDIQGEYKIDLVYDTNQTIPLHLGRWVSHVLYIIILGFSRVGMPWKSDYLTDVKGLNNTNHIDDLIWLIYGGEHDTDDFIKTLRAASHTSLIRDVINYELGRFGREDLLYWFAPNNMGRSQFVIPLPPNAIDLPNRFNWIFENWRSEIRQYEIRIGQPYDIEDFQYTNHFVDEVVASLDETATYFGFNQSYTVDSQCNLGDCASWIRENRNMDDPNVLAALAEIYEHNPIERKWRSFDGPDVLSRNYAKEAFHIWEDLAHRGYAQGQYRYATHYILGQLVDQNFKKAVRYLKKAVRQEHADATWLLGKCYFYGHGVLEDKVKAFKRYKQAADLGSAGGARDAAICLMEGIGTERDERQAYGYLKIAAEKDLTAQCFCQKLMGDDYQVTLPEERIAKMVEMYHSAEWEDLRFHFNPETQAGEPRLERLMHCFGKLGSFGQQQQILDLLDQFHYIPGEMSWIERVNRALHPHTIANQEPILEIVASDSEKLSYDVRFHLSDGRTELLSSWSRRIDAIITYIIVAAFSSRLEGGFTTSYAIDNKYANVCHKLWMAIDNNASRFNVRMLVNMSIIGNPEGETKCTRNRIFAGNLGAVNNQIERNTGLDSMYFTVPDIQNGRLHYRRIHKSTKIILPREIEDIIKNIGMLDEGAHAE